MLGNANRAEDIIKFCETPRTWIEIADLFGFSKKAQGSLWRGYLKPLIEDGRLTKTIPEIKVTCLQKYVATGHALNIPTFEKIIEFCNVPRRYEEIEAEFALTLTQARKLVMTLLRESKVKLVKPLDKKSGLRVMAAESDYHKSKEETLLEYCLEPRTVREVADFLSMSIHCSGFFVKPLLESGRLVHHRPARREVRQNTRYVNAESDYPILSDATLIEFCKTPKSMKEIHEHFRLGTNSWWFDYVYELVEQGKLITKYPSSIFPLNNQYVAPDTNALILNEATIIEYCKVPRSRKELATHFDVFLERMSKYVKLLMGEGKLKGDSPHKAVKTQLVVAADVEIRELNENTIIEFCQTPKTRKEIQDHFALSQEFWETIIEEYIIRGVLKCSTPKCVSGGNFVQKYVAHNSSAIILTQETLIEYCKAPKRREEIKSYFDISDHQVAKYIKAMLKEGVLKTVDMPREQGIIPPLVLIAS